MHPPCPHRLPETSTPTSTPTKGCSNYVLRLRSQSFYFRNSPALSTAQRIHPTLYTDSLCPYQPLPVQLSRHRSSPPLLGTCAFLVLAKFSKPGGFANASVDWASLFLTGSTLVTLQGPFQVASSNLESWFPLGHYNFWFILQLAVELL